MESEVSIGMAFRAMAFALLWVFLALGCSSDRGIDRELAAADSATICDSAGSLSCILGSDFADCGLAFQAVYWGMGTGTSRSKCETLCASEESPSLTGIWGDRSECYVLIQGLTCDLCCALSDASVDEVPCVVR